MQQAPNHSLPTGSSLGHASRLEVEEAAAREMALLQKKRAAEATALAERANLRATAAMDDAREARDREFC